MPLPKPNESKATPANPSAAAGGKPDRKPWKKKSPVEIVLDQAEKLKAEIAEAEEELKAKKRQLEKFEQARKLFEAS